MKNLFSFFFIFLTTALVAQKRLSQSYDTSGITALYINSNEVFEIRITATQTDQITVHTIIEGETFASTLLNTTIKGGILKLTTGKTPDFEPFNDKLSVHKVMAIELEVVVPIGLDVSVYSTLASLDIVGDFGQVRVDLGRGYFVGKDFGFSTSAKINTLSGSITLDTRQATVSARSRNGTVVMAKGFQVGMPLELESLHGDILVTKSL